MFSPLLQWSHVFSDMVRGVECYGFLKMYIASMEPCLFRHGKAVPPPLERRLVRASMEPCLFRHGKQTTPPDNMDMRIASMEPCLFRHGKMFQLDLAKHRLDELQWSHVFSDMVRPGGPLQGSGASHASMEPCLFRHGKRVTKDSMAALHSRFNGAMSFQTW